MTYTQILDTLKNGGYICRDEYAPRPVVYDGHTKTAVGECPISTMERIANTEGMTEWLEEWGGAYVGPANRGRHSEHENSEHCRLIADELDEYAGGRMFKCPECGETINIPDDREKHRCSCGYVDNIDEFEQLSIYDYLEDVLDIEYRCDGRREYRSVQIMVACGGPNIYIDTASHKVELYWWGDKADWPLSSDTEAAVDEWAEEYWGCM